MPVGRHTFHINAVLLEALRDVAEHTGWPLRALVERAIRRETRYLARRPCRAEDDTWVGIWSFGWDGRQVRRRVVRHTFIVNDAVVMELKRFAVARRWPMRYVLERGVAKLLVSIRDRWFRAPIPPRRQPSLRPGRPKKVVRVRWQPPNNATRWERRRSW
jgi:hypothetical protein